MINNSYEDCEDCKAGKCQYSSMSANLWFCFYDIKNRDDGNEEAYQFILRPKSLDLFWNDILVSSFNIKGERNYYYFYELKVDTGLLKECVEQIFLLIGYDPKKGIGPKPKVKDVYSFLEKKQLDSVNINFEKVNKLNEHNILCIGFGNGM